MPPVNGAVEAGSSRLAPPSQQGSIHDGPSRSTTPPPSSLAPPGSASSELTSLGPSPVKTQGSTTQQQQLDVPSSSLTSLSTLPSSAPGPSTMSFADRLRAEARQRAIREEAEEEQRRQSRRRLTSASPDPRDDDGDSDDSLGDILANLKKRPRLDVASPPPPADEDLSGAESGASSPTKRPSRATAKQGKYRFQPKMYQSSRVVHKPTAAELAKIRPEGGGDARKLSIDALLREKKKQERKGTDMRGIEAVQQSIMELDRREGEGDARRARAASADDVGDEIHRAMRDLEESYLARAEEGLGSPDAKDHRSAAEDDREASMSSSRRAAAATMVDYGFFEKVEKIATSSKGPVARADVLEVLKKTAAENAEDNEDSDESDEEESQQQKILDIVAQEDVAPRTDGGAATASSTADKHAYFFWSSGPIPDPAATWSTSHAFKVSQGFYQKDVSSHFVAGLLTAEDLAAATGADGKGFRIKPDVFAAAVHGDETLLAAAWPVALDVMRHSERDEEGLKKIAAMLSRELRALGAPEVGESAFMLGWREKTRRSAAQARESSSSVATLSSVERQVRIERVLRLIKAFLSLRTASQWQAPQLRLAFLTEAHAISCDDWSRGSTMQTLLNDIMELRLASLPWSSYAHMTFGLDRGHDAAGEGWGKWIFDWLPQPPRPSGQFASTTRQPAGGTRGASWPAFAHTLQRFASTSVKARTVRRSKAYWSHISGMSSLDAPAFLSSSSRVVGPIVPDLKIVCDVMESDNERTNPFYIPPRGREEVSYRDIEARVQLLGIAMSDLALQLCAPPQLQASTGNVVVEEPVGTQQGVPTSQEELANSILLQSTGVATPTSHRTSAVGTPNTSSRRPAPFSASSSSSLLDRNIAFQSAVSPYLQDLDLLTTFNLSPTTLAPDFTRLKQVHRLIALLRTTAGRIVEGRRMGTGGRDGQGGEGGGQGEGEDPIWRARAKDSMQRLALMLHYQCEAFTRFKVGSAGDEVVAGGVGASANDTMTTTAKKATGGRKSSAAIGAGGRATDQRSLDSFFGGAARGAAAAS